MQFLVRKHIKKSVNRTAFSRRPEVSGAAEEKERERALEISVFALLHNMVVLLLR
jgi:hypothetical protein